MSFIRHPTSLGFIPLQDHRKVDHDAQRSLLWATRVTDLDDEGWFTTSAGDTVEGTVFGAVCFPGVVGVDPLASKTQCGWAFAWPAIMQANDTVTPIVDSDFLTNTSQFTSIPVGAPGLKRRKNRAPTTDPEITNNPPSDSGSNPESDIASAPPLPPPPPPTGPFSTPFRDAAKEAGTEAGWRISGGATQLLNAAKRATTADQESAPAPPPPPASSRDFDVENAGWNLIHGSAGIVVNSARQDKQDPVFLPMWEGFLRCGVNPRNPLDTAGWSTYVVGTSPGPDGTPFPDEDRVVPLSNFWMVASSSDVLTSVPQLAVLAWICAPGHMMLPSYTPGSVLSTVATDAEGNLHEVDASYAGNHPAEVVHAVTSGVFCAGIGTNDRHRDASSAGLVQLHFETEAPWFGQGGDGPLRFEPRLYTPAGNAPFMSEVHLRFDPGSHTNVKNLFTEEEYNRAVNRAWWRQTVYDPFDLVGRISGLGDPSAEPAKELVGDRLRAGGVPGEWRWEAETPIYRPGRDTGGSGGGSGGGTKKKPPPSGGGGGGGGGGGDPDDPDGPLPPACFLAGTRISTGSGARCIEELQAGDIVTAITPTHRPVAVKVQSVLVSYTHVYYVIETDNAAVKITGEHPMLVLISGDDDWVLARDVDDHDNLITYDGFNLDHQQVVAKRRAVSTAKIPVYNLTVEAPNTFVANGFVVHNKGVPGDEGFYLYDCGDGVLRAIPKALVRKPGFEWPKCDLGKRPPLAPPGAPPPDAQVGLTPGWGGGGTIPPWLVDPNGPLARLLGGGSGPVQVSFPPPPPPPPANQSWGQAGLQTYWAVPGDFGTTGLLLRGVNNFTDAPAINRQHNPSLGEITWFDSYGPIGARVTSMPMLNRGGDINYTFDPADNARYSGGTASSFLMTLPPELDGGDFAARASDSELPTSSSVINTMAPGVSLGFGWPDVYTGGMRAGWIFETSTAYPYANWDAKYWAEGLPTTVMQLNSAGITLNTDTTVNGKLTVTGAIDPTYVEMDEQASVPNPGAGDGTFWILNSTPNVPRFTDDSNTSYTLAYTTSLPAAHNVLSASHGDTLAAAVARGSLIAGNATPKWAAVAIGATAGNYLRTDGTDPSWSGAPLLLSDGTLAAPAYSFSGATGTGMYRTAGGALWLSHAGVAMLGATTNLLQVPVAHKFNVVGRLELGGATFKDLWLDAASATIMAGDDAYVEGRVISAGSLQAVALLDGGTHSDTATGTVLRGDLVTGQTATPKWTRLALGAAGTIARSNGTDLAYSTFTIPDTYVLGDILHAPLTNVLSALAGNTTTTRKFLRQTGTGMISAAPAWDTLVAGDVPDLSATYVAIAGVAWTDLTDGGASTAHKHDHGGQDGLGDDDHTQYALLAGRVAGQTLIGSTAAGGALNLESTSHVTKGEIYFGASGGDYYDEVNRRLVLGRDATAAPMLVTSTFLVSNLNADLLDGQHAAAFAAVAHTHVKADITDTPWAWADVSKTGSSLADLATRSASDLATGTLALARGGTGADLSATGPGVLRQLTAGAVATSLLHNWAAAVAPTANEDSGDGYAVGSFWFDTTADKAYCCLDATVTAAVWTEITQGAGAGDVVGPGSATDNAIARFDTTTGKLLQNSNAILADDGLLELTREDAGLTTAIGGLKLERTTSGVSASIGTGFGTDIEAWLENRAGASIEAGNLRIYWQDPVASSEDAVFAVHLQRGGALLEALVVDSTGALSVSNTATTRTNLGLAIGTNVQAYDAELAALAGLVSAADKLPYFTGLGTAALADFTAAGRALLDDADAAAQRTTLGLAIGTNVQAWDADLDELAALSDADSNFIVGSAGGWVAESGATARASLGLGTIATQAANNVAITGGSVTGITDLAIADGGTGASLADPGADRILFWDETANAVTWLSVGSGLAITGTEITATGGGLGYTCVFVAASMSAGAFSRIVGTGASATALEIPQAGTITALAWFSASADSTTDMKIHVNGVAGTVIDLTGAEGVVSGLSIAVAAGDYIQLEFDAGTNPGTSAWTVYVT